MSFTCIDDISQVLAAYEIQNSLYLWQWYK